MNCHFCQQPLEADRVDGETLFYKHCEHCSYKNGILGVWTNDLYAIIYVPNKQYRIVTLPGVGFFQHSSSFEVGRKYQFRLHLKEDFTNLCETTGDTVKQIAKISGFPINLENAKEKLQLYLTFS